MVENAIAQSTTYYDVIIIALDYGEDPELPSWFNEGMSQLPVFFSDATFGNFIYQPIVLKADEELNHAFIFPEPFIPQFSNDCDHVHKISNMIDVIEQADAIYGFDTLDFDGDDIVYVHFTSIGPKSGGIKKHCIDYVTNDVGINGNIIVKVNRQSRGVDGPIYLAVFYHESGHDFFNFPDMNHSNVPYDHYGIGAFDVMCGGGFLDVPSLYNPWFRQDRGWALPTLIESNSTGNFQDYQTSENYYMYLPNYLPTTAYEYQKFIISCHTRDNQFYQTWPFNDPTAGEVLVWHVKQNHVESGGYSDWRRMALDLESAHGKFTWEEYPDSVHNTGVEDPLTGRDSLEIRKISIVNGKWKEIQGPYYDVDDGSASTFYNPDEAGDFSFYSNPNSNWYRNTRNENYAQNVVSGFSMKNLRTENNVVKADFYIDDITIPESMTLPKGKWHFYNDLIVPQNVTLTLETGTEIDLYNGADLLVNGNLIIVGGASGSVTIKDADAQSSRIFMSSQNLIVNTNLHCYANIVLSNGKIKTTSYGQIYFYNGKGIRTEGISLIYSNVANKLKLDFVSPENNSGIYTSQDGYLHIWHCNINNSGSGIQTGPYIVSVSVEDVNFNNCSSYCINITGSAYSQPLIQECNFDNLQGGIAATNLNEIKIFNNQFINTDQAIYLSNVSQPYVSYNNIESNKKTMPGIFLSSCNGFLRENTISGHSNGIVLGNSIPDIGGNEIINNLYHGIYIGTGSLPNLEGSLAGNPPAYYALSGYNTIYENGGTTIGGPPDNDGSEIYFYNSNAQMREGCNSIYDDRAGSGEHPPYNTRLLINGGNATEIEIHADGNYWSDNPLYPLEERFGDLIVYYEPFLSDPCDYVFDEGGDELLVKSSSGEVIDTLYPLIRTVGTLSSTELLYAEAEEKFITADYNGAEVMYNQIINGSDPLKVKLKAYRRLFELGKLSSKPGSYFYNLKNTYTSLSQSTTDSLMVKIFKQLGSLSLIAKEEYVPAISEFDEIIQQNPGSEEAVYSEIDALTAALLIQDTTLNKTVAGKYRVDMDTHGKRINQLLKNNFGAGSESEEVIIVPDEYQLYQNYPNPFNPVTTIKYDISETGIVVLAIYDILGRKIRTLVNQTQQEGRYEISFNATDLSSGVYLYQLKTNNYIDTKKMILIK